MAELVYAYVSEAYGAILEGSSPSIRTIELSSTNVIFCQRDEPTLVSSQKITFVVSRPFTIEHH